MSQKNITATGVYFWWAFSRIYFQLILYRSSQFESNVKWKKYWQAITARWIIVLNYNLSVQLIEHMFVCMLLFLFLGCKAIYAILAIIHPQWPVIALLATAITTKIQQNEYQQNCFHKTDFDPYMEWIEQLGEFILRETDEFLWTYESFSNVFVHVPHGIRVNWLSFTFHPWKSYLKYPWRPYTH